MPLLRLMRVQKSWAAVMPSCLCMQVQYAKDTAAQAVQRLRAGKARAQPVLQHLGGPGSCCTHRHQRSACCRCARHAALGQRAIGQHLVHVQMCVCSEVQRLHGLPGPELAGASGGMSLLVCCSAGLQGCLKDYLWASTMVASRTMSTPFDSTGTSQVVIEADLTSNELASTLDTGFKA